MTHLPLSVQGGRLGFVVGIQPLFQEGYLVPHSLDYVLALSNLSGGVVVVESELGHRILG